jgi:hypothetical protein
MYDFVGCNQTACIIFSDGKLTTGTKCFDYDGYCEKDTCKACLDDKTRSFIVGRCSQSESYIKVGPQAV